ncbi:hypothetical protein DICVIV_09059 [Dictyocaulus viviparus]|uniref:Uncharacterized protein n=1 Tax=Dictyocaulus viviparus TaxID=29172 RepID=A0A0D8XR95_DICVI|nr:hypothetical protein DICVIV_09059 [Dictyocaulus viviparus]
MEQGVAKSKGTHSRWSYPCDYQSRDPGQPKSVAAHNGAYRNNETHGRTVTVRKNTPSHRRRSFNPVETEAIMKLSMCFPFDTSMRLMNISIIAKCSSFYHRRHHLHVKSNRVIQASQKMSLLGSLIRGRLISYTALRNTCMNTDFAGMTGTLCCCNNRHYCNSSRPKIRLIPFLIPLLLIFGVFVQIMLSEL